MRNLNTLNDARRREIELSVYGCNGNSKNGLFAFPSCVDGELLRVVASSGSGWDHVSVSRVDRVPSYEEMEQIAKLFFEEHEYAMQLHVPATQHVNVHPHCLHWWRPTSVALPIPPRSMVG